MPSEETTTSVVGAVGDDVGGLPASATGISGAGERSVAMDVRRRPVGPRARRKSSEPWTTPWFALPTVTFGVAVRTTTVSPLATVWLEAGDEIVVADGHARAVQSTPAVVGEPDTSRVTPTSTVTWRGGAAIGAPRCRQPYVARDWK